MKKKTPNDDFYLYYQKCFLALCFSFLSVGFFNSHELGNPARKSIGPKKEKGVEAVVVKHIFCVTLICNCDSFRVAEVFLSTWLSIKNKFLSMATHEICTENENKGLKTINE